MDDRDFIREVKNFFDRFFAEWIELNKKRDEAITKDLEEMEENYSFDKKYERDISDIKDEAIEFDIKYKEKD